MARTVKDTELGTRQARLKLKAKKRFFRGIHQGLALCYRRGKEGSGTWGARVLLPNGTYTLTRLGDADDYAEADGLDVLSFKQAQARAVEKEQEEKRNAGRVARRVTVEDAIEAYRTNLLAEKGQLAAHDAYLRLKKHVPPTLMEKAVADLGLRELQEWRNALVSREEDPVSRGTANRIMANLKASLNGVFRDEQHRIPSDKAWRALESFEDADNARKDNFEAHQVERLISAARKFDEPFADLLTASFLTGARYGELAACDVKHFHDGVLSIPSGKTGARVVTLFGDAISFFARITKGRDRDAPLLAKEDGTRWGKSEQHRRMKRALVAAKLSPKASLYALRHSHISRAIEEDVPLFIIARNCGTSEKMISDHYAHLIAKKERTMLERAAKAIRLRVIQGGAAKAKAAT